MTFLAVTTFFAVMLALAVMPSASVALVVARSSSGGVRSGVAAAIGIVTGDLLFVGIAILGSSAMAFVMGSLFSVLKYIGGAYLIWLGFTLIRSNDPPGVSVPDCRQSTLASSFASGLLLTLGDLKAILFYASLFPTLTDVAALSAADIAIIVAVTVVTVGGVKLVYAIAAQAIVARLQAHGLARHSKRVAGGLMIGTGGYLVLKP